MISVTEAAQKAPNKHQFYLSMVANGWVLPAYADTIVTIQFLKEVKGRKCYCPHESQKTYIPCPNPPTVAQLVGIINDIARGKLVDDHPLASEIVHRIVDFEVLMLAMLLHDVGKGGERGQLEAHLSARRPCSSKHCYSVALSASDRSKKRPENMFRNAVS